MSFYQRLNDNADPVLLCNELGTDGSTAQNGRATSVQNTGGSAQMSVKEAVQIAKSNNLMGLMCSWRLLKFAPALIEAIKTAGLVLIADLTGSTDDMPIDADSGFPRSHHGVAGLEGIDGMVRGNAVLRFNDSVDM
jgi:CDK inhibitor PHO81